MRSADARAPPFKLYVPYLRACRMVGGAGGVPPALGGLSRMGVRASPRTRAADRLYLEGFRVVCRYNC